MLDLLCVEGSADLLDACEEVAKNETFAAIADGFLERFEESFTFGGLDQSLGLGLGDGPRI